MNTMKIAYRNIFRNGRRSVMTVLAISVSSVSILLFGGFVFAVMYGLQTGIVQTTGHLHIYQKGFFTFGSGNPGAYGIRDYRGIIETITEDPELKDLVEIATPMLKVFGIAGNFEAERSKTFFGQGMIPSERDRMAAWNDYGLRDNRHREPGLRDDDPEGGMTGIGMARMLGLCEALGLTDCAGEAPQQAEGPRDEALPGDEDFSALVTLESGDLPATRADGRPKIDLLAATAAGAPNVLTLYVNKAENQGVKEVDDSFVAMHLSFAQRLLYGKGEKLVTGIVVQLRHTADLPVAVQRLEEIFADNNLDLEVQDFTRLSPNYGQIISMFAAIFTFLAMIMGVIVLFTIVNTMSMSVMERINEIGTVRALGSRRSGVMRLFLTEGCLLGALGATIGSLLAAAAAFAVNSAGITWTPPNNVEPVFLTVLIFQNRLFLPLTWAGLILLAVVSSFLPARKAARMVIVDALRHV